MTAETFGEVMSVLETACGRSFGEKEQAAWWWLIGDLPDDAAREATLRLCRRSPYPPKPADIVNAVLGDPRSAETLLAEEAELALAHFEEHFTDCLWQDFGVFINAVLSDMGGPDVVGMRMVKDEWKYDRERFITLYKAHRRRGAAWKLPALPHNVAQALDPAAPLPVLFEPGSIPGLPAPGVVDGNAVSVPPAPFALPSRVDLQD